MNNKMYVGNLPFSATEAELRQLFSEYGDVTDIHLPMERESGRPRGFAFVSMSNSDSTSGAIAGLNAKEWNGRVLAINEARPMTERAPRSGGDDNRVAGRVPWNK